ncbi:MAG: 30S ribosomal protein S20 [Candidatus Saganbacteria bacterium]|nr:30S ribosomal protein S20 [Candidatus Saganbacteria bacterium]
MASKKPVKRKHVKNVRKTKKQRARNVREKNLLKLTLKAARAAVITKAADVLEKIKQAASVLDKAAERGLIHANKAARLKSRLNLAYNKTK